MIALDIQHIEGDDCTLRCWGCVRTRMRAVVIYYRERTAIRLQVWMTEIKLGCSSKCRSIEK